MVGGENDFLVSERGTRKMAALYGVEPLIVPGAPHNLMMEAGWEKIAESIRGFLAGTPSS